MHPIARVTALGRAIDPRYPSNRYAVAVSGAFAIVGLTAAWIGGAGIGDALAAGARTGLATFLSWAVARELDPDRPESAAVAAPLAGIVEAAFGGAALGLVAAMMVAGRIVARSTGLPLKPVDFVGVVALAAYVGTRPWGALVVAAITVSVIADDLLGSEPGWRKLLAPAVVVAGGAASWLAGSWPEATDLGWAAAAFVAAGVAGALLLPRHVAIATTDHTGEPLDPRRVAVTRVLALLTIVAVAGVGGEAGVRAMAPITAAFIGGGVVAMGRRLVGRSAATRP